MCDFSAKLIAWHDGELPDGEAAAVEQHVLVCSECRDRLGTYQEISGMVNAYCDATLASETRGGVPRWAPVLGAAASVALLLLIFVHRPAVRSLPDPAASAVAAIPSSPAVAAVLKTAHAPVSRGVRRHSMVARAPIQDARRDPSWLPAEPDIQIAIPGEAMFPPGALPPGVDFVADVSIATDGSAQRLRLQPQLAGFKGGSNR